MCACGRGAEGSRGEKRGAEGKGGGGEKTNKISTYCNSYFYYLLAEDSASIFCQSGQLEYMPHLPAESSPTYTTSKTMGCRLDNDTGMQYDNGM